MATVFSVPVSQCVCAWGGDLAQIFIPGVFFSHEDSGSGLKVGGFRSNNSNLYPKLAKQIG